MRSNEHEHSLQTMNSCNFQAHSLKQSAVENLYQCGIHAVTKYEYRAVNTQERRHGRIIVFQNFFFHLSWFE